METHEENLQNQEQVNQSEIKWTEIALQACVSTASALVGGFAAAAGAYAFSKLVNRHPTISDLGNVVDIKSKIG